MSRLSAYHHFGMISPFKVARDALATRSNGATKYVDEFFTWREVAHAFCFRSWPALESTQASACARAPLDADAVDEQCTSLELQESALPTCAKLVQRLT